MKGRFWCLVLVLQMASLVAVTSRPFASHHDHGVPPALIRNAPESPKYPEFKRGWSRIGSSPPICDHKCYGCRPCKAIQVPTTSSSMGVQYANYKPEGWQCKCGQTFYNP